MAQQYKTKISDPPSFPAWVLQPDQQTKSPPSLPFSTISVMASLSVTKKSGIKT
jgi:hypothetical protein